MKFDVNNPYFRTKVLTASPEELRLLLLEGCIGFIEEGRTGLAEKDFEKVYSGFSQAKDIVMELMDGLRPEINADLCRNIASLYTFIYRLLMEASFEKSTEKADQALELMRYERETWLLLMEKLRSERGSDDRAPATAATGTDGPAPTTQAAAPAQPQHAALPRRGGTLSVQG